MPSSLTWLDHDAAAQARSATLLALLDQPGTRDELGFGGIRDALSDQLFPGTSVIQTRLRYMLLLPRMFMGLEASSVRPRDFAERARQDELKLNDCLAAEDGAFGRDSGHTLKAPCQLRLLGGHALLGHLRAIGLPAGLLLGHRADSQGAQLEAATRRRDGGR